MFIELGKDLCVDAHLIVSTLTFCSTLEVSSDSMPLYKCCIIIIIIYYYYY